MGEVHESTKLGLYLTWTNSGIEFEFYGTAVYIDMEVKGETVESQAVVGTFIDGRLSHDKVNIADSSMKRYVAASGLKPGKHTIKILKLSELRDGILTIKNITVVGVGETVRKLLRGDNRYSNVGFIG